MAARPLCTRAAGLNAPHYPEWKGLRRCWLHKPRMASTIHASQSMDDIDRSKFYKELGLSVSTSALFLFFHHHFLVSKPEIRYVFSEIEDSVSRAEMLAPTALELEEERHIKQEKVIREYDLWDDLAKSNEVLVKLADSAKAVHALKDLKYKAEEVKLITELAEMDVINYGLFKQAYTASTDVSKFLDKYEMSKLLKGPYEVEGACLTIEAGAGGIYPERWAEQLKRMYTKWAGKQGFGGRIVEKCPSKHGGLKSATIEFESKYAYGYLSGERGIHRMISSHNGSALPEASLAAVDVIPLFLEAAPDLLIDDKDLKISTLSSCEEERTKPAVHIEHIPTGLRVQSSDSGVVHDYNHD
ncbi:hypothetical protein RJ639_047078 [Escallonia herrerae]|uniref:Peptide chain release factor domain-containing protein n=1 Tax=Escallonia herrerae TaxID=1293975 RepID=A0AA88WF26_9ASTE|nr:hypothetical protein RJ639_047078 [Escallonia herrerae]